MKRKAFMNTVKFFIRKNEDDIIGFFLVILLFIGGGIGYTIERSIDGFIKGFLVVAAMYFLVYVVCCIIITYAKVKDRYDLELEQLKQQEKETNKKTK